MQNITKWTNMPGHLWPPNYILPLHVCISWIQNLNKMSTSNEIPRYPLFENGKSITGFIFTQSKPHFSRETAAKNTSDKSSNLSTRSSFLSTFFISSFGRSCQTESHLKRCKDSGKKSGPEFGYSIAFAYIKYIVISEVLWPSLRPCIQHSNLNPKPEVKQDNQDMRTDVVTFSLPIHPPAYSK